MVLIFRRFFCALFSFILWFIMSGAIQKVNGQPVWTFDCDQQGWGTRSHHNSFIVNYLPYDSGYPSGRIAFRHTESRFENWLFAPVKNRIDAGIYKHLFFSLDLTDAGAIPSGGINALFVWISDTIAGTLRTKTFKIYKGSHIYHLDLSTDPNWKGVVEISRFHFPSGDQRSQGYVPETARYVIDWIACSVSGTLSTPVQDTQMSCKPYSAPVLSKSLEALVFGTSVSLKTYQTTGGQGQLELTYVRPGDSVRVWNYGNVSDGPVYASLSFLQPQSEYSYVLRVINMFGRDSITGSFITEREEDYNLRGKKELWFTPSPFAPDINGLFVDNGAPWNLNRVKNRGFHVREDQIIPTDHNFSQIDVRAMIFELTKRRMHLSMEASGLVPGETASVVSVAGASVKRAFQVLDKIYSQGGKLDYLSPDCTIKRVTGILPNSTAQLTMEQAFDAVALYFTGIHQKYPGIAIGYLVNLPNWHFEYKGTMHFGTAGGSYTTKSGYTFDRVLTEISKRLAPLGEKIAFVEVDNPYKPYYKATSVGSLPGIPLDNPAMLTAVEEYCHENNMAYGLIFNSAAGGGASSQSYYNETMQFLEDYLQDHGIPDFLTVESWYKYPDRTLPADEPYSFMYLLHDFESALRDRILLKVQPENARAEINIFPNPAGDHFYISGPGGKEYRMRIFSISGALLSTTIVKDSQSIRHGLNSGIYLVVLDFGETIRTTKLVIQKKE
jgi:hypothetical protein